MPDKPMFFVKSIRVWRYIGDDWVDPGWYRRTASGPVRLQGWRLVRHRILWGFGRGLVDAR